MYQYEILKMRSISDSHCLYGLLCKESRNDAWVTIAVAAPFSGDLEATARLAEKCTSLQLSPAQMLDVVGDFVTRANMDR